MKTFFTPNRLLRCHAIFFVVCVQFCIGGTAHAATCDAGQYITDGGECVVCTTGYYCPGDDARYECPNGGYVPLVYQLGNSIIGCVDTVDGIRWVKTPDECMGNETYCWVIRNNNYYATHGFGSQPCYYNPETGTYDYGSTRGCVGGNTLQSCDAGYWAETVRTGGELQRHPCVPSGVGYYSPDDDLARYPCTNEIPANSHYAGTEINKTNNCEWECDDGFGHTSDDRCLPLCRIGETAMNGINIYAEKHTKYAMAVPRNGATCWISAEKGQGGKLVPTN